MNIMNDNELKTILAKMLPETVRLGTLLTNDLFWHGKRGARISVLDTELLHICSLAEAGLTGEQRGEYIDRLCLLCRHENGPFSSLVKAFFVTWQQRVTALAVVKGGTL